MRQRLEDLADNTVAIYLSAASAALEDGQCDLAKRMYRRANSLVRKTSDAGAYLIGILLGLGSIYLFERKSRKAELMFKRAQQLAEREQNCHLDLQLRISLALAESCVSQRKFKQSAAYVKQVMQALQDKNNVDVNRKAIKSHILLIANAFYREQRVEMTSKIIVRARLLLD